MQRELHTSALAWPDKTMSVIQQRQLEACEERLNVLPAFGLYDGCDDSNAEELWKISYSAQEEAQPFALHGRKELEERVLADLPQEAAYLTHAEYDMVLALIAGFGKVSIDDWSDVSPAESLVRRLWCTIHRSDGSDELRMPKPILRRLMPVMQSDAHLKVREQISRFHWAVICALNVCGIIYADDAVAYLHEKLPAAEYSGRQRFLLRMLKIAFDYTCTRSGEMVLLHPGMADPDRSLHLLRHIRVADYELTEESDSAPQFMISDAERAASGMLYGLIHEAMRPDVNPGLAVEDLRLMAHQAVGFESLSEVLASQLSVRPTREMLDALRVLQAAAPSFSFVASRVVH